MTRDLNEDLKLLAHERRRAVVSALLAADEGAAVAPVDGVRGAVGVQTDGGSGVARPDEGSFAVSMRHLHLPMLDRADVVDWNQETGTVRRGDRFEEVAPLFRSLRDAAGHREDWV